MQIPLEISYRDVNKTEFLENLIREKAKGLERYCDHIIGCRIAVEKPNATPTHVNPFRVRIDITVPPGHEIVVTKNPGNGQASDGLTTIIREAFDAARKQLQKISEKQRDKVKVHPEQEAAAIVTGINKEDGFGFLTTINGREIYFHKNSVLNNAFESMEEGTSVNFFEEEGEKGPKASTVRVIELGKPNLK